MDQGARPKEGVCPRRRREMADGEIVTYFKPDDGIDYYHAQCNS